MNRTPKWDGETPILDWIESLPPVDAARAKSLAGTDDALVNEIASGLAAGSTVDVRKCASPIEQALFDALLACGFNTVRSRKAGVATLYQQLAVETWGGRILLDFAVVRQVGVASIKLAIEADGHDFHHATKEQVEADNIRTRALAKEGWIVVRYSGSEITRDAQACALDAAGIVIENVDRIRRGKP